MISEIFLDRSNQLSLTSQQNYVQLLGNLCKIQSSNEYSFGLSHMQYDTMISFVITINMVYFDNSKNLFLGNVQFKFFC